jgi:cell division protein FtsN
MQQARNTLLSFIIVTGSLFCSSPGRGAESAKLSYATEILKDVREDKVYLLENIRRKVTKPSEKTLVEALLTEDGPKAARLYRKQLSEHPDPQLDDISRSRLAAYDRAVGSTPKPSMPGQKPSAPTQVVTLPASAARRADTVSRQTALSAVAATPNASAAKKADSIDRQAKALAAKPVQSAKPASGDSASAAGPRVVALTASKAAAGGSYTLQFGSFDSVTNADHLAAQLTTSSPARVLVINGIYKVRLKKVFATREEASAFGKNLPIESFVVTALP